ncbi:hypothetical protein [Streptomyces sp. ISL-94]|uniref:hypothetical protein n=1 Tax=Streptomyces sp. ISL-94 TaxID=2819190 RepID=UPI001BE73101|nr:hypothetical protein [Streptomyces sp. ISL-94]MBT2483074.1 hypothetical protein [Streptomyces sp. ISL-94]
MTAAPHAGPAGRDTAPAYEALPFDALWDRPGIGTPAEGTAEPPARAWQLAWDALDAAEAADVLERLVARDYAFPTSGSTREPVRRTLPGARLRADSEQLARLLRPYEPQALVSFAPSRHAYGASATVLLPAVTRLPVWFWPASDCPPPPVTARRIAVVAVPGTFRILARHPRWLAAFEHITFLHSSAELPPDAVRLSDGRRTAMVEVLGSTEAGAVAHRTGWDPDGPWTLLDDVSFAGPREGREIPLTVSGPRLSALPDGSHPAHHAMDDLVRPLGDRQFLRLGRRARPVKPHGVRQDLDGIAARLRALLPGADVTCVRAADALLGETYDLRVAGGGPLTEDGVRALARGLGAPPREVRVVDRPPRGPLGTPPAAPPPPPHPTKGRTT